MSFPRLRRLANLCGLFLCLAAVPAQADGELQRLITPDDARRLQAYEPVREKAIADARAGGDKADVKVLDEVLKGELLSMHGKFDATGEWRCRTIKLGGGLPIVVYGWFKCRIVDDGEGWRLDKYTGSQRTTGRLFTEGETRLVYLGAGYYDYEKPRSYKADPQHDQVAYVVRPGNKRLRFEFPSPKFESNLDIVDLRR